VHLENYEWQELFLSKTISVFTGKQYSRYSWVKQTWLSLERYMFYLNSEKFSIWNKTAYLQLEKPELQEVLLTKTNWILKGNNALYGYDEGYNIDGFLWGDTCVSSTPLNIRIRKN
jgi:hypothetical protein